MKKSLYAAMAVLALVGCNKIEAPTDQNVNPENPDAQDKVETIEYNFTAVPGSYVTKTALEGMKTVWEAEDAISLFGTVADSSVFAEAGVFTTTGDDTFSGLLPKSLSEGLYDWVAIYPECDAEGQTVTFASTLSQTGSGNTSHLAGKYFPMAARVDGAASADLSFQMKHLAAIVQFNVKNNAKDDLKISSFAFTAPTAVSGSFKVVSDEKGDFQLTALDGRASKSVQVLFDEPLVVAQNEIAEIYLSALPFSVAASEKLEVLLNGAPIEVPFAKKTSFEAGIVSPVSMEIGEGEAEKPVVEWSVWDGKYPAEFKVEGEGTMDSPYLIKSAADFAAFGQTVNTATDKFAEKYIRLETNIDLNNKSFNMIGTPTSAFSGCLDGAGHIVKNLNVTYDTKYHQDGNVHTGLFKVLGNHSSIVNLILENVKVAKAKDSAGALVGTIGASKVCIRNVSIINPLIESGIHAGGLVGSSNIPDANEALVVFNSSVKGGKIVGTNAGGLFGLCRYATFIGCCTSTDVFGNNTAGGLIGQGYLPGVPTAAYNKKNSIAVCYTKSHVVNAKNIQASGISGLFAGEMVASYSDSNLEFLNNSNFAKHVNSLFTKYVYRVEQVPSERMPVLVKNSFAPRSVEPIENFHYHIQGGILDKSRLDKSFNGYYSEVNGVQQPTAEYMSMKMVGKDAIGQEEVDKLNEAIATLTAPEYHGINAYHFELTTEDEYGFPAVLVESVKE